MLWEAERVDDDFDLYTRHLDFPRGRQPDRRSGQVITSVYRLYDETYDLIYVGITNRLVRRIRQHAWTQPWGNEIRFVEWNAWVEFTDRAEAAKAEVEAIQLERPRHNTVHRVKS